MNTTTEKKQNASNNGLLLMAGLFFLVAILIFLQYFLLPHRQKPPKTPVELFHQARLLTEEELIRPPKLEENTPVLIESKMRVHDNVVDTMVLTGGAHIALKRHVEVRAFRETPIPREKWPPPPVKLKDKFHYQEDWIENPTKPQEYKVWAGHAYPPPEHSSITYLSSQIFLGRVILDLNGEDRNIFGWHLWKPDKEAYKDSEGLSMVRDEKYLHIPPADPDFPKPGDMRFWYEIVDYDKDAPYMTALGVLNYNRLVPYRFGGGKWGLYAVAERKEKLLDALIERYGEASRLDWGRFVEVFLGMFSLIVAAGAMGLYLTRKQ